MNIHSLSEISVVAAQLCPGSIHQICELDKGGNSRIYRIEAQSGTYALKQYPVPSANDSRNRLLSEANALRFMRENGIVCVPDMVAMDTKNMFGLLSWCEGEEIAAVTDKDLQDFTAFLAKLAHITKRPEAQRLANASEACLCPQAILQHIEKRLHKLRQAAKKSEELHHFLHDAFMPYLQQHTALAKVSYQLLKRDFENPIAHSLQTLIPSDYGAHNALRGKDGLVFLDFEYFGWDDPVTSTVNFVLHPAMQLRVAQKEIFCAAMEKVFSSTDPLYASRLQALLPLYAARWAMIILGEFIPAHWQHRVKSGKYREDEKRHVLAAQLSKAKNMLACAPVMAEAV